MSFATFLATVGQGQTTQNDPWIVVALIAVTAVGVCLLTALHTQNPRIRTHAMISGGAITFVLVAILTLKMLTSNG